MCFEVKDGQKVQIASQNIECWKILSEDNTSIYKKYTYKDGEICPRVKLVKELDELSKCLPTTQRLLRNKVIYQGYHSYSNKDTAAKARYGIDMLADKFELPTIIVRFIIPAGTKYYENKDACEYVSETIVMNDYNL